MSLEKERLKLGGASPGSPEHQKFHKTQDDALAAITALVDLQGRILRKRAILRLYAPNPVSQAIQNATTTVGESVSFEDDSSGNVEEKLSDVRRRLLAAENILIIELRKTLKIPRRGKFKVAAPTKRSSKDRTMRLGRVSVTVSKTPK